MALNSGIHWGCILRVNVDQAIKQDGWKWLLQICNSHNFDGEIFGGHSTDVKSFRECVVIRRGYKVVLPISSSLV